MNANCYKVIFSKRLGTLVAVGEHTTSSGKAASGQAVRCVIRTMPCFAGIAGSFVGVLRFSFASIALACLSFGTTQAQSSLPTIATSALPQGASVNKGSASISTSGAQMAINQSSDKASINWQSFNVGTAASVNIAQPSASAVLLNRVVGNYQKIELTGALSQSLDRERIYTGTVRWKAQAASKNLDNYNRMSLGGISAIRAYSSIDGVGDQGLQMSFDVIHQIVPDVYGGLFYDVGVIKNSHSPLSNATDTHSYLLQGAGWQVGGKIHEFNWSLSTAHAFGKTPGPGVWTTANTQPGDFRVNFALTRPF